MTLRYIKLPIYYINAPPLESRHLFEWKSGHVNYKGKFDFLRVKTRVVAKVFGQI